MHIYLYLNLSLDASEKIDYLKINDHLFTKVIKAFTNITLNRPFK